MTKRLVRAIIDTDIGGDPDDAMAIALAVASPELTIEGITTVYSDVLYHARRVARLLDLADAPAYPIYNGASRPLLRSRKLLWGDEPESKDVSQLDRDAIGDSERGAEGNPANDEARGSFAASESEGNTADGVDSHAGSDAAGGADGDALDGGPQPPDAGRAVDFIIRTIMDNPGEITLICIGPLTNIAAAIIVEPKLIVNVKELVIMGGVTRLAGNAAELGVVEHNVKCDPEAAAVVFGSGAPIVMVGLDVTHKTAITRAECERLIHSGKPANAALADVIGRWLDRIGGESTPMHDPLAVAVAIDRSLLTTQRMRIEVAYDHREGTGQTIAVSDPNGTVDVGMDVDAGRFLGMLFERLCKQKEEQTYGD